MSTMLSAAGRRLPKQNSPDFTHATDFVVMESSGFDDHEKTAVRRLPCLDDHARCGWRSCRLRNGHRSYDCCNEAGLTAMLTA